MKMPNQTPKQTSSETSPPQKLVLPQVRYHPSIQAPGAGDKATTKTRTRTSWTQKTRPPTNTKVVQENQEAKRTHPAVRPGSAQEPGPAAQESGPAQKPGPGECLRPEQVALAVEVQLDQSVVDQVEALTRGQRTNPDWFAWRKNRITASVAHRIIHSRFVNGKSQTPPPSYLAAVTGEGPRVQTRAMSWGVQKEAEAVRRYQVLKSAQLGRRVSVLDCGLFIDARRPWLAASPDGIVTDSRSGQWLRCLEVKCPYKHRQRRVEDACRDDPAFCLQIEDQDQDGQAPVYRLKTTHSYFTQIQVQLAVTGLQEADFVVFTLKETAVVPVTFDPGLWEDTVSKLETFYRDAILPYVHQKTHQDATATGATPWTPEL